MSSGSSSNGLPTPRWQILPRGQPRRRRRARQLAVAVVVKPANEGSSVGVSIVDTPTSSAALATGGSFTAVIVEDYIAGTELFVGILNGRVLGSVEVRPATRFYDYEAKYKRTDTKYLIPPELPAHVIARSHELALAAYQALGCTGHARPDLRISTSGEVFVLEVNTLPGMTKTSLLPKIARNAGMDYPTLCEEILETATTICQAREAGAKSGARWRTQNAAELRVRPATSCRPSRRPWSTSCPCPSTSRPTASRRPSRRTCLRDRGTSRRPSPSAP
jgi:D-alanine--D-alanine ligase